MGERSWSPQLATSPISHKMPRFSSGKDYTLVCIMGGALLEIVHSRKGTMVKRLSRKSAIFPFIPVWTEKREKGRRENEAVSRREGQRG